MEERNQLDFLDSLRGIAAWMVCLFHASFWIKEFYPSLYCFMDIGQEGVYVFFVISGLVLPWSMDAGKYQWKSADRFLSRRWLRLYPPFFLSVVIYAIGYFLSEENSKQEIISMTLHSMFLTGPFFGENWINEVYWTLFVEFQFYIYLALFFPLIAHQNLTVRTTALFGGLALALLSQFFTGRYVKLELFFHLPVFTLGYYLYLRLKGRIGESEFWIGLVVTSFAALYITGHLHGLSYRLATVAIVTALLIYAVRRKVPYLDALGEVSYSFYLTHWFVISMANYWFYQYSKTETGSLVVFIGIQVGAILLAALFYRVVEMPSLRWTKKIKYRV
jgi:peptidoglycan/LPS O-acetylase OafA/YrhL